MQALINQLYETFNVREYSADMERVVIAELEDIRLQLEPLEQVKNISDYSAHLCSFHVASVAHYDITIRATPYDAFVAS